MKNTLVTVVEHAHYLRKAQKLLTSGQMDEVAGMVAADPQLGEIVRGTGGFRKFRYAGVKNKGKSGGMRVVHLFVANDGEIHIIDIFEKSEKENLTKVERNELAKIAALLKGEKK